MVLETARDGVVSRINLSPCSAFFPGGADNMPLPQVVDAVKRRDEMDGRDPKYAKTLYRMVRQEEEVQCESMHSSSATTMETTTMETTSIKTAQTITTQVFAKSFGSPRGLSGSVFVLAANQCFAQCFARV